MPNHFYPSVRHCIYCGETKLLAGVSKFGDEHIIPLALGGNLILSEASCKICERIINREIETPVLSQEWGYLRSKREFPTRNSRTHVFVHRHDGSLMKMPVADYPSPVPYTNLESLAFLQDFRLGPTICDGQWKFLEITIAKRKCDEGIRTGTVITY